MIDFFKNIDYSLFQLINTGFRNPVNDIWLGYSTWLGDSAVVAVLGILFLVFYDRENFWKNFLVLVISCLVAGIVLQVIKSFVHRARPLASDDLKALGIGVNVMFEELRSRSFPSGHSQTVFSVAIALALRYPKDVKLKIMLFVLCTCVCVSRIYVGAHFPSDVLGGAVLGTLVSFGVIMLVNRWDLLKKLRLSEISNS